MHNRFRDILLMRKTGKVISDSSMFDKRLGSYLNDRDYGGVITTTTGNPISIITNKAQNAISTLLSYSPKQSGSGDPSPQNIRPIEGWTEAGLFGCGKNLLNPVPAVQNATIGTNSINAQNGMGVYIVPMVKGATYAVKNRTGTGYPVLGTTNETPVVGASAVKLADMRNRGSYRYTNTDGYKYLLLSYGMNSFANYIDEIWIESGETPTTYEPYITPTETIISLGGTYYGFSVDVVSGKMSVTHGIVDLGDLPWTKNTQDADYTFFATSVDSLIPKAQNYNFVCTNYLNARTIRTKLSDKSIGVFNSNSSVSWRRFVIRDDDKSTLTAVQFREAMRGVMVAYQYATPIEIDLTPQTVALLAGNNTIWTDGDEVTLTYKAKKEG